MSMSSCAAFTMKKEYEGIMKRNMEEERTTGVVGGWGKEMWEGGEGGGGWRERGGSGVVGGQENGIAGSLPHLSGDEAKCCIIQQCTLVLSTLCANRDRIRFDIRLRTSD